MNEEQSLMNTPEPLRRTVPDESLNAFQDFTIGEEGGSINRSWKKEARKSSERTMLVTQRTREREKGQSS